jgi:hypothetical protein
VFGTNSWAQQISNSVMAVTSSRAVSAYGRRTRTEWERVMTNTNDRELTEAELDCVVGGDTALAHEATHSSSSGGGTIGCGGGGGGTVLLGLRKSSGGQATGVFF